MANADKTLKNKDQLDIYPITRERNVYDENNVNLKTKFETVVFKDNNVHKFAQELYEESANLLNPNEIEIGSILPENGKDMTSTNIYRTGYISCKPNTSYVQYGYTLEMGRFYYYDESKNYITNNKYQTFKTPSNAYYFRYINSIDENFENIAIIEGNKIPDKIYKYNPNRNITNSEAEFLKEEFEKQSNIMQFENYTETIEGVTITCDNGDFTINGTSIAPVFARLRNKTQLKPGTYTLSTFNSNTANCSTYNIASDGTDKYSLRAVFNAGTNLTTTNEIDYTLKEIYLFIGAGETFNNFKFNYVIVEGTIPAVEPYQYNSSSHITNPQADFLKSEYDKQLNLLPLPIINHTSVGITVICDGSKITIQGTATSQYLHYFDLLTPIKLNGNYKFYYFNGNYTGDNNIALRTNENTNIMDSPPNIANKINSLNNINATVTKIGVYVPNGETVNVEMYPLLVESNVSVDSPYRYNGKIIHEKDIEPVVLWENPIVNSEMGENTQALLDNSNKYNRVRVLCKRQIYSSEYFIVEGLPNEKLNCVSVTGGSGGAIVMYRKLTFSGSNVAFSNCFFAEGSNSEHQDNSRVIPIKIWGLNV